MLFLYLFTLLFSASLAIAQNTTSTVIVEIIQNQSPLFNTTDPNNISSGLAILYSAASIIPSCFAWISIVILVLDRIITKQISRQLPIWRKF
jgi:hypothetical protein